MLARRSQEQVSLTIRQPISHPASPSLQSSQDPLPALPGSTGHARCHFPKRRGDEMTCDTGTGGMAETARWPIQPQSRPIQPGGRFSPNQGRSSPSDRKGSRTQKRLGQTVLLSPPSLPLLPLLGLAVHNVQPEPVPCPSLPRPCLVPSLSLPLTCAKPVPKLPLAYT